MADCKRKRVFARHLSIHVLSGKSDEIGCRWWRRQCSMLRFAVDRYTKGRVLCHDMPCFIMKKTVFSVRYDGFYAPKRRPSKGKKSVFTPFPCHIYCTFLLLKS